MNKMKNAEIASERDRDYEGRCGGKDRGIEMNNSPKINILLVFFHPLFFLP